MMGDKSGLIEAIEENTEAIEDTSAKKRRYLNPIYWIGLFTQIVGSLLCLIIIGLPIGAGLISSGRKLKYKNKSVSADW